MSNQEISSPMKQKYLGNKGLMIFIVFLSAFIPLSTDLYIPALPGMAKSFSAPASLVNLTIILFFIFYAAGTLLWGPLSDKFGRKKILLTGLILYFIAGILCALADNLILLIIWRILQAIGCGASVAVSTAIVKYVYSGRKREMVLALVQSMSMIAPIIAPVLGALIIQFLSWHGVFWALSLFGLVAILGAVLLQETMIRKSTGTILHSLGRLVVVARNPRFLALLITFSLSAIPMLSFVSFILYICKYIWFDRAGLQLLFCCKCHLPGPWALVLYRSFKVAEKKDHYHCLFRSHSFERIACIYFGRFAALAVRAHFATLLFLRGYYPSAQYKFIIGSAA